MNLLSPILLTSTLLLGACAAEPISEFDVREGSSIVETTPPSCPTASTTHPGVHDMNCLSPVDDLADPSASDPETCAELDQKARALIAQHMTCTEDMQCEAVPTAQLLGSACAPAFSCYVPMSSMADMPTFLLEAREIDRDYAEACSCPLVDCVNPDYMLSLCGPDSCSLAVDRPTDPTPSEPLPMLNEES